MFCKETVMQIFIKECGFCFLHYVPKLSATAVSCVRNCNKKEVAAKLLLPYKIVMFFHLLTYSCEN